MRTGTTWGGHDNENGAFVTYKEIDQVIQYKDNKNHILYC